MYSDCLDSAVAACSVKLAAAGLIIAARIQDSFRAVDLAVSTQPRLSVLRCVPRAKSSDYHALRTMLAQGDFDRAILVYCDRDQSDLPDDIESWWIGDAEALAASLAREAASA